MLIQIFFKLFVSMETQLQRWENVMFSPLLVFYSDCDLTRNGRNADNSHCAGWQIEWEETKSHQSCGWLLSQIAAFGFLTIHWYIM